MDERQKAFFRLVEEARSCRRFAEAEGLPEGTMEWLVDCVRIAPCAKNEQAMRYVAVTSPEARAAMRQSVGWASALTYWKGPEPGECPPGYLVVCGPQTLTPYMRTDLGIIGQTVQLAAASVGLAACMFMSFNPEKVQAITQLPAEWHTALVIAVGKPAEERRIAEVPASGRLEYWRDEKSVHHVPKLGFDQVFFGHK